MYLSFCYIKTASSTLSKSSCFASSASTNPATVTQAECLILELSQETSINSVNQREPKILFVYCKPTNFHVLLIFAIYASI